MNESLEPCPFCGQDSIIIDKYQCEGEWWHFAECEECMAQGPVGKTEQDAADAWNEKAMPLIMPPHVISEIEKAAKKIHDCVEFCDMCVANGECGLTDIDHKDYQCRTAIAKVLARAAGWSV